MADALPWLFLAGLGLLHGLNPASAWLVADAWRVGGARPVRALVPVALGHLASAGVVAFLIAAAPAVMPQSAPTLWQVAGGTALLLVTCAHLRCGAPRMRTPLLAVWSFAAATAHGTGMMLVPALVPLCLSGSPAREITASGSLPLVLAAFGVHTVAMLAATGFTARLLGTLRAHTIGSCRPGDPIPRPHDPHPLPTATSVPAARSR